MKKHIILSALLCLGFTGSLLAQSIVPDTLLFVFKLHGQTRKYEMSFREKQDSICLYWGIERNLKWQSGSYTMGPKSIEQAIQLSFLQPEDGKHVQLSPEETAYFISRSAYKQLKEQNTLVYNQTTYSVLDSNERALGYPLIHVKDAVEGCEMWILDNPKLSLVWRMRNNPLGVNWEISTPEPPSL